MVGLVLVSHSRALALAAQELVRSMTGSAFPLAIAAGAGEDHAELGTNAVEITEAITAVFGPEGVLVLMDMGSAVLSAETALDFLEEPMREKVRLCPAPFLEGAVAAGVTANLGSSLEEVFNEAQSALKQKAMALPLSSPVEAAVSQAPSSETPARTVRLQVRNLHGLHARPATRLISASRPFRSEITVRNLTNGRGPVSVKSLSSLASLEILQDNEIEIAASGDDAPEALDALAQLTREGFGETLPPSVSATAVPVDGAPSPVQQTDPLPISSGIAFGPGLYMQKAKLEIPLHKIDDIPAEIERLRTAVAGVQKALEVHLEQMTTSVGAANAKIYDAQILSLQDPELLDQATSFIRTERANAAQAWDQAHQRIADRYRLLKDAYMRERAADLEDVSGQVLESLAGKKAPALALSEPCILIADDLTPSQVSSLAKPLVKGVILLDGGPTAHSSILLKSLGFPTVIQARAHLADLDLRHPGVVALDGSTGKIWLNPEESFLTDLQQKQAEEQKRKQEEGQVSHEPCVLRDGERIEIVANIGQVIEAESALQNGAEGIGLLRTEFLFLEKESPPTEDEQVEALRALAATMRGKPVTIRTLDAGGDKELPYLQMPPEANPFLGVRAIRLCFQREPLFTTQLRAILRAGHGHDFRLMFPMIATRADLDRALACLEKAHGDLEREAVLHLWPIETGIMVEIPSAALQAEALAERAQFFSIGTNDLTQYTLAADRGNPALSSYQDALHPAVLRLIRMVVEAADKRGRLVAVCGEAASDEIAAGIFVGLGVRELSLSGAKIPHLKAVLREKSLGDLQRLAKAALGARSADDVRVLVRGNLHPAADLSSKP